MSLCRHLWLSSFSMPRCVRMAFGPSGASGFQRRQRVSLGATAVGRESVEGCELRLASISRRSRGTLASSVPDPVRKLARAYVTRCPELLEYRHFSLLDGGSADCWYLMLGCAAAGFHLASRWRSSNLVCVCVAQL